MSNSGSNNQSRFMVSRVFCEELLYNTSPFHFYVGFEKFPQITSFDICSYRNSIILVLRFSPKCKGPSNTHCNFIAISKGVFYAMAIYNPNKLSITTYRESSQILDFRRIKSVYTGKKNLHSNDSYIACLYT
ncbi:hypothetical protein PVK06_027592 [Gossypium arboreum]|uniref:Uncharacterized protein n=1 Tax=Gossypium arboreum TaxID=29729 RepID=A0ABR0P0N2_GOSAR|nr:hypothetical protein PVK06_027592 [Gossypium arboreum]